MTECQETSVQDNDKHACLIWYLQVSITPLGVFGGWLTATPSTGVIHPKSQTAIQLVYDVSQNEFQGRYQAQLLLTTTARPVAKVGIHPIASSDVQEVHPHN